MERFPPSQTMGYHIIAGNYTKQYATAFSTYYLFIGLYYQLFHFVNFGCKITTL